MAAIPRLSTRAFETEIADHVRTTAELLTVAI
jgi:hypothetical protein